MQPHRWSGALALGLAVAASGALATPLESYKAFALSGAYTPQNGYTGDLTLLARPFYHKKAGPPSGIPRAPAKAQSAPPAAPVAQPDLLRFEGRVPAPPLAFTLQAAANEKAAELKTLKFQASEQK
ncbi:MAG TPA: hypothetical protein VHO24_10190 [Opitutaceae bacterium]|nr:hypothetical protein [Opitutaceae bacterium]